MLTVSVLTQSTVQADHCCTYKEDIVRTRAEDSLHLASCYHSCAGTPMHFSIGMGITNQLLLSMWLLLSRLAIWSAVGSLQV